MIKVIFKRIRALLSVHKLRYKVEEDNRIVAESATAKEVIEMIFDGRIHDTAFVGTVIPAGEKDLQEEYGKMGAWLSDDNLDLPRPIKRSVKPFSYAYKLVKTVLMILVSLTGIITGGIVVFWMGMQMEVWRSILCAVLLIPMALIFGPYEGKSFLWGLAAWLVVGFFCFTNPMTVSEIPQPFQRFVVCFVIAPPSIAIAVLPIFGFLGFLLGLLSGVLIGSILGWLLYAFGPRIPKGFYKQKEIGKRSWLGIQPPQAQ